MEEKIKELKEKFEGSNKYMLNLTYEDIKQLFEIIEILRILNRIDNEIKNLNDFIKLDLLNYLKGGKQ